MVAEREIISPVTDFKENDVVVEGSWSWRTNELAKTAVS